MCTSVAIPSKSQALKTYSRKKKKQIETAGYFQWEQPWHAQIYRCWEQCNVGKFGDLLSRARGDVMKVAAEKGLVKEKESEKAEKEKEKAEKEVMLERMASIESLLRVVTKNLPSSS
ncbi:hypothetical protein E3N88_20136 [Mikania micrantha]|uniref:Uncharacterized protein n=1 Tax=Mikania micrantha TaxID=192012 RepID=A0A5N6NI02_9ASTR|nr:hypothetical protein E3N88_20136 [Mikania micrantha]